MYVPEFNCFMRRLEVLIGEAPMPNLYVNFERETSLITEVNNRPHTFRLGPWTNWTVDHGIGSFGVTIKRTLRGVHVVEVEHETGFNEIPDYW